MTCWWHLASRKTGRSSGPKAHPEALFELLDSHRINLAAAALPRAVVKDRHLIAGPVLFESPVYVVTRVADQAPRSMTDLAGKKLALIVGSGHTPMLMRLKRKFPKLSWATLENVWPEELLAQLQAGKYDAVVINGMDFDPMRNVYPELEVAFNLADKQEIVWALPNGSSQALRNGLARFVEQAQADGLIKRIYERYFGHLKRLDNSDILGICSAARFTSTQVAPAFSGGADADGHRLAAAGRDRLSGIAVEYLCHFANRGAWRDDADR